MAEELRALRRANRELDILNRVTRAFLSSSGHESYSNALDIVLEALHSKYGVFGYIDDAGNIVCPSMTRHVWDRCRVPDKSIVFPRQTWGGIWGRTLAEGKSEVANHPLPVPTGHVPIRRTISVPLLSNGAPVSLLVAANKATNYTRSDLALLERIAESMVPVLSARLEAERQEAKPQRAEAALRQSQAALERSRAQLQELAAHLFTVQEEERRRVSRELHDDLNQKAAMLAVDLEALQQQPPSDREVLEAQLNSLKDKAVDLSEDLRHLAHQLHPSILEHLGLEAALRSYRAEFSRREGIAIKFTARDVPEKLPEDAALCLYRVAQEALRNIARHSGVRRAGLRLYGSPTEVCLAVSDRGRGFDPAARDRTGLGLISMEERVRLAGGRLKVKSRPGQGTRIEARIARPGLSSKAG